VGSPGILEKLDFRKAIIGTAAYIFSFVGPKFFSFMCGPTIKKKMRKAVPQCWALKACLQASNIGIRIGYQHTLFLFFFSFPISILLFPLREIGKRIKKEMSVDVVRCVWASSRGLRSQVDDCLQASASSAIHRDLLSLLKERLSGIIMLAYKEIK